VTETQVPVRDVAADVETAPETMRSARETVIRSQNGAASAASGTNVHASACTAP
jgi:hypothetical protein